MSFDIPTVLALCTFSALLSAVVLGTANARDPFPGVREAIFAALALAAGFVLQLLRDRRDGLLVIVTANGLFFLAAMFIDRACRRFAGELPQPRWPLVVVGASVALSAFEPAGDESWDGLFQRADEALYRSKREGRNRVSTAPPRAELASAQANP